MRSRRRRSAGRFIAPRKAPEKQKINLLIYIYTTWVDRAFAARSRVLQVQRSTGAQRAVGPVRSCGREILTIPETLPLATTPRGYPYGVST